MLFPRSRFSHVIHFGRTHNTAVRSLLISGLAITVLASIQANGAQAQTETPTPTPMVEPTLDPSGLDFSTAKLYTADNDIFEMQVPLGWTENVILNKPDQFLAVLSYGDSAGIPPAFVSVSIGSTNNVFRSGDGSNITAPDAALKALIASQTTATPRPGAPVITWGKVTAAKLGKLDAFTVTATVGPYPQSPQETRLQAWAAILPNGMAAEVSAQANTSLYDLARPTLNKMIDSLVFNGQNLALPTPTIAP